MTSETNPFGQNTPPPSTRSRLTTPQSVQQPLPHIEHRRRVISFKVAVAALSIFGATLFAISLMTLNIYFPSFAPVYFAAVGGVCVLSFTAFIIASVKFVHGWLNRINTTKQ